MSVDLKAVAWAWRFKQMDNDWKRLPGSQDTRELWLPGVQCTGELQLPSVLYTGELQIWPTENPKLS